MVLSICFLGAYYVLALFWTLRISCEWAQSLPRNELTNIFCNIRIRLQARETQYGKAVLEMSGLGRRGLCFRCVVWEAPLRRWCLNRNLQ